MPHSASFVSHPEKHEHLLGQGSTRSDSVLELTAFICGLMTLLQVKLMFKLNSRPKNQIIISGRGTCSYQNTKNPHKSALPVFFGLVVCLYRFPHSYKKAAADCFPVKQTPT